MCPFFGQIWPNLGMHGLDLFNGITATLLLLPLNSWYSWFLLKFLPTYTNYAIVFFVASWPRGKFCRGPKMQGRPKPVVAWYASRIATDPTPHGLEEIWTALHQTKKHVQQSSQVFIGIKHMGHIWGIYGHTFTVSYLRVDFMVSAEEVLGSPTGRIPGAPRHWARFPICRANFSDFFRWWSMAKKYEKITLNFASLFLAICR